MSDISYQVGIIGAGWVGKALAAHLTEKQITTLVTARSQQVLNTLANSGLTAVNFDADFSVEVNSSVEVDVEPIKHLQKCHTLVICIPPKMRTVEAIENNNYGKQIANIINIAQAKGSHVKQLILLSSTAVYGGLTGAVNEQTPLAKSNDKSTILQNVEQQVLSSKVQSPVVLRLAGLIGYNRFPGRFFAGRTIADPESVVNLIHRDDVIKVLSKLIEDNLAKQEFISTPAVLNVVAPTHPSRKSFYGKAVSLISDEPAEFNTQPKSSEELGKQVDSIMIDLLNVEYTHPCLMTYLENSAIEELNS
ncbi:2-dehydropantoate 2-reductase N-terminal domain-containing protein [Thalassotalea crassostreae]|uniref:2-dehydropantoate 2-reductase N-terminal domain-containing protein n=1 Tax=Thalassotalea crassostreae TaxID=1763536 RepID=UPI000839A730|nr:2-dehydropantoate 2-reductase N-terminal domain-containing protein [Thalassotalea crassostreae]